MELAAESAALLLVMTVHPGGLLLHVLEDFLPGKYD